MNAVVEGCWTSRGEEYEYLSFLDQILLGLHIKWKPEKAVEAYMRRMVAEAPPSDLIGRYLHRRGVYPERVEAVAVNILCAVWLLSVLGVGVGVVAALSCALAGLLAGIAWSLLVVVVSIAVFFGIICFSIAGPRFVGPAEWITVPVNMKDLDHLPRFVQENIRNIHRQDPGNIRFEILKLMQNFFPLDPILVVIRGTERRYTDIWDKDGKEVHL